MELYIYVFCTSRHDGHLAFNIFLCITMGHFVGKLVQLNIWFCGLLHIYYGILSEFMDGLSLSLYIKSSHSLAMLFICMRN